METIRALLARGFALERVLAPFTTNPARLLRLAGKGTIATGADADLVVLDQDAQVRTVIVRGVVHVQDGKAVRRGTFEDG
jgi:beta-aspartyl-dipeptidase (metallo-type)